MPLFLRLCSVVFILIFSYNETEALRSYELGLSFKVQMILMDHTDQLERGDDTEDETKTKGIPALQEYSG